MYTPLTPMADVPPTPQTPPEGSARSSPVPRLPTPARLPTVPPAVTGWPQALYAISDVWSRRTLRGAALVVAYQLSMRGHLDAGTATLIGVLAVGAGQIVSAVRQTPAAATGALAVVAGLAARMRGGGV